MTDFPRQTLPIALLEHIPEALPQPRFQLGETVKWMQVPQADFGRIIGVVYSDEASCRARGLHYLILLDDQSPSRNICTHDFAFEADIERLEPFSMADTPQRGQSL